MNIEGILDQVITGSKVELGIGLEAYEGMAVKAQKKIEIMTEAITPVVETLFATVLRNAPTMRHKQAPGMAKIEGPINLLITPEGGSLLLWTAFLPDTVTGGSAPYTHTFANAFGAKSVTMILRIGNYLFVLGGVRVVSMSFENLNGEPTAVLAATTAIAALTVTVYDMNVDTGAYARFGMDTAAADTLPAYSGVQMVGSINGHLGVVRSATLSITKTLTGKKTMSGKRGYSAHYETETEVALTAVTYFENLNYLLTNWGLLESATLPVGIGNATIEVSFSIIVAPANNGSGFSNTITINVPAAILETRLDVKGMTEVDQNITFYSKHDYGAATDITIAFVNSVSSAALLTAAAPIPNYPLSDMTDYFSAAVNASPSPTTTAFTADNGNIPSFSTLVNDPTYLSRSVLFLTGTCKDQFRGISAYAVPGGGLGGAFTVGTPFAGTPAAGDIFTVA